MGFRRSYVRVYSLLTGKGKDASWWSSCIKSCCCHHSYSCRAATLCHQVTKPLYQSPKPSPSPPKTSSQPLLGHSADYSQFCEMVDIVHSHKVSLHIVIDHSHEYTHIVKHKLIQCKANIQTAIPLMTCVYFPCVTETYFFWSLNCCSLLALSHFLHSFVSCSSFHNTDNLGFFPYDVVAFCFLVQLLTTFHTSYLM